MRKACRGGGATFDPSDLPSQLPRLRPGLPTTVPLRFTYSAEGPQHIELLEGAPGSIWDGREEPGLHHIGVWCEDVGAETRRLVDCGWTFRMGQRGPDDGFGAFTYVQPPSGLIVELVRADLRPMFERWFAGGPLA